MTDANALAVKEVFEQRSMYDAVVDGNYMHHAELFAALGAWAERFARPLRIVDLGCGDAGLATKSFTNADVEHYVGIDLAESSIEQARVTTSGWWDRVELICGNLLDALHGLPDGSTNVVLASYSLHHFSSDDKRRLLGEIARALEPGGTLLWIDAVRAAGESRDDYIERLTGEVLKLWTNLTHDERERAVEHIRTSDFPETEAWMMAETARAGFVVDIELLRGALFCGWAFVKKAR